MNAIRQIITSTKSDSIVINLPPEYRDQKLEIIVLPFSPDNEVSNNILDVMDKMSDHAKENGLSPEKLEELLNA